MTFSVYIDDSGTDKNQPIANATALIIPAERILDLEQEFDALKRKEGFSDFHTSIFVARNPKSEFAKWSDGKQKRVFRRMRQITRKYVSQAFSLSVNKAEYNAILPDEFRNYSGKYHFTWAVRHVVPFVQHWRISYPNIPAYEWIYDWMEKSDPARKEVEKIMDQAEEQARLQRNVQGDYANFHFRGRSTIAGLQCADLVAWTNYQFSLKVFRKKPLHPLALKAWHDFAAMPQTARLGFPKPLDWNESVTIKPSHLKTWLDKEMADGRSLEYFREWEARKKTEKAPKEKKKS